MLYVKKIKNFLFITALSAGVFASAGVHAADSGITTIPAVEGSYCHMRFPALRSSTLASRNPQLKGARSGDIIDYYGACDHDPQGRDEVTSQRLDEQQRWQNDYES